MQIQINSPQIQLPDALREFIERNTTEHLGHHAGMLTRIEVHLSDTNANKGGVDKRCLMEARPRGMDPLVAEHEATEFKEAFKGALDKLQRVLEKRFGKLSARERGLTE
ncbi:MAG: HPF/RaiA family ribosome-associated protein [Planctomycetes bacterium]|nr:HPF/RaiA family ribosome-associated protein [Planctomycetota bacterium]